MKRLLYYNLNSQFVSDQTAHGGDGTSVVSVVHGVAFANDSQKSFFQHSSSSADISTYTVTVHYSFYDIALRKTISVRPDDVYSVKVYSGMTTKYYVPSKPVDNYELDGDEYVMINVSGNTEVTFNYKYNLDGNRLVFYISYLNAQASPTGYTMDLIGNDSALDGLIKIILDNETEVLPEDLDSGTSLIVSSAKTVHKVEYVYDHELTDIPYGAFSGCDMDKIIFPTSVTGIGDYAFRTTLSTMSDGTPGLSAGGTWTIPGHIKRIGNGAFSFMRGAWSANILILEDGIEYIGHSAFEEGSWTIGHVSNTLKYIGGSACFKNSDAINGHLVLPDSLETLDSYGNYNSGGFIAARFTGITFGKNLSYIGYSSFIRADDLVEVTFTSPSAPSYISSYSFPGAAAGVSKTMYYPAGGNGYDRVVSLFTDIGWNCYPVAAIATYTTSQDNQTVTLFKSTAAYTAWSAVTAIMLDDGVTLDINSSTYSTNSTHTFTSAGEHTAYFITSSNLDVLPNSAFCQCQELTKINIIGSVKRCLSGIFYGSVHLTEAKLPDSIAKIEQYSQTFRGCTSLVTVNIPSGLGLDNKYDGIPKGFCYGCTSLKNVIFPKNPVLQEIAASAFTNCTSLERFIMPDTVVTVSWHVFQGCGSLKEIHISSALTYLGEECFYGCRSLEEVVVPASLGNSGNVGNDIFYNCTSLRKVTWLPETSSGIWHNYTLGKNIFFTCKNLERFEGPMATPDGRMLVDGVSAFTFAPKGLVTYAVPDYVTYIGAGCFRDGLSLTAVSLGCNTEVIDVAAFSGLTNLETIGIPNTVLHVGDSAFDGTKYIIYNAPVYGNIKYVNDFYAYIAASKTAASYTFRPGTKVIGSNCLKGCTDYTAITIPSTVQKISYGAFYNSNNLTTVTFESSDTPLEIGSSVFSMAGKLGSITLPNRVNKLGSEVFSSCSGLTSAVISNNIEILESSAFRLCTSLTSITLGTSIKEIKESAFINASALTTINIPDSVQKIGNTVFSGCTSLASVSFGTGLTNIGYFCFNGCTQLLSITCSATTAPTLISTTFRGIASGGTLRYPSGSDYSSWLSSAQLGGLSWTGQAI